MFVANTLINSRYCGMPLCKVSRVDKNTGRQYSCIVEHQLSGNKFIGCGKIPHRTHFILPDEMKSSFQPGVSCSEERSIEIRKGIAERNIGKLQEPSW